MTPLDWETLRHALAVGNAGSIGGAARALGVNHTTVLRRLDALEQQLGTRLFERQRSGYQPTEAGLVLLVRPPQTQQLDGRRVVPMAPAVQETVVRRLIDRIRSI